MKETKRQLTLSIVFIALIFLILIGFSISAMQQISQKQKDKTYEFLTQMTEQYRTTINRQIQYNWETLQGIATFVEHSDLSEDKLMDILEKENANNHFMRMGYIRSNGIADLADISGKRMNQLDLNNMAYVKKVLSGQRVLSDTLKDSFGDGWINVYAIPVYQNNKVEGAICAVSDADSFSNIVDLPAMGVGYADILNRDASLVIRSAHDKINADSDVFDLSPLTDSERETFLTQMKKGKDGSFFYTYKNNEYLANYVPLSVNDWYLISIVPSTVISGDVTFITHLTILAIIIIVIILILLTIFITHIILKSRRQLEQIAYYDDLTNSYTKNKFEQEAIRLLNSDRKYSLIFIDIANFKQINELFGNQNADRLLIHIAKTLKQHLEKHEIFFRDNADCFGLLLHEQDPHILQSRMQVIIKEITSYELHPQQHYQLICFTGIKIIDSYREIGDLEVLMTRGMMALKEAKRSHNNHMNFYDQHLYEQMQQQIGIEQRMYSALEQEEFIIHLQPKYDVQSSRIVGAEALIRWNMGSSFLYPDSFIPIFEKNGFITKLDMYVLSHVCAYMQKWKAMGLPRISININQSRLLFYRENYLQRLSSIIDQYDISPERITLEVTESVAVENVEVLTDITQKLHSLGFHISMDDFGSGYSSLNVLQSLDFDEIKLDRIFLSGKDAQKQKKIIRKMIELCHSLSIATVAEGVETKEQYEYLKRVGCDTIQGYYFAKPMPVEEFEALLLKQMEEDK